MICRTSKQITEVKETGNMYHESTYLVVKSEYASAECEPLEREARKILRSMDTPSGVRRAWGMSFRVTRVAPPAVAAVTAAILHFVTI